MLFAFQWVFTCEAQCTICYIRIIYVEFFEVIVQLFGNACFFCLFVDFLVKSVHSFIPGLLNILEAHFKMGHLVSSLLYIFRLLFDVLLYNLTFLKDNFDIVFFMYRIEVSQFSIRKSTAFIDKFIELYSMHVLNSLPEFITKYLFPMICYILCSFKFPFVVQRI